MKKLFWSLALFVVWNFAALANLSGFDKAVALNAVLLGLLGGIFLSQFIISQIQRAFIPIKNLDRVPRGIWHHFEREAWAYWEIISQKNYGWRLMAIEVSRTKITLVIRPKITFFSPPLLETAETGLCYQLQRNCEIEPPPSERGNFFKLHIYRLDNQDRSSYAPAQ